MTEERIREIAARLRQFGEFAQSEYIDVPVRIDDYEYYVDLGAFGEQSMYVTIEDQEERVDADNFLDSFPIDSATFISLAEELEESAPAKEDVSLETVLERMEQNGEVTLARVLSAVTTAYRGVGVSSDSVVQSDKYGVSYDAFTAPLEAGSSYVRSEDLRIGDSVSSYGRVVRVERLENGDYRHTFLDSQGNEVVNLRESYSWLMYKIVGWDDQPTALSLSKGAPGSGSVADYDPLTVPLQQYSTTVVSSELRLGDDITGRSFGRVVGIDNGEIVMNREGDENRVGYNAETTWSIRMIDVPDRNSVPTAVSLQPVF